jgi:leucyl aminopeptidase
MCVRIFALSSLPTFLLFLSQDHPKRTNALRQERVATYEYPSTVSHRQTSLDLFESIDVASIRSTIASMSAYQNRYYTSEWGVESVQWLASEYQGVIDASGRSDANVTLFEHSAWAQPSIVATINGVSDEILVFGGHIDSTAPGMPTGRAPGADDDASGSAVVLEMFRILVSSGFVPGLNSP